MSQYAHMTSGQKAAHMRKWRAANAKARRTRAARKAAATRKAKQGQP